MIKRLIIVISIVLGIIFLPWLAGHLTKLIVDSEWSKPNTQAIGWWISGLIIMTLLAFVGVIGWCLCWVLGWAGSELWDSARDNFHKLINYIKYGNTDL